MNQEKLEKKERQTGRQADGRGAGKAGHKNGFPIDGIGKVSPENAGGNGHRNNHFKQMAVRRELGISFIYFSLKLSFFFKLNIL